jgi:D-alanyl-lipoteichoic acid acyltransferase DltB (MBOAT superfamily)
MNFNTLEFLLFLPAVLALHWALPHRLRWALLLASSWLFYFWWEPMAGLLLVAVTAATWLCGLGAAREKPPAVRRACLAMALGACLGCLGVFKYAGFFAGLIHGGPAWRLLLPVGISFYTFQALSYVLDVYRGRTAPEGHFGYYALFISFFPQLVAGPIERSGRLLPQLRRERTLSREQLSAGGWLLLTGYFKKAAIADGLAPLVDAVYAAPGQAGGPEIIAATALFGLQIYCDFSGYSDIARGAAGLLGVELMENFQAPYAARSIREFWRRWHISLTAWFTDYVYIPLGGSRRGLPRRCFNIMAVFLLSGLWHGADWTFVAWGGIHGIYQVCGVLAARRTGGRTPQGRGTGLLRCAATFSLVTFAWLFFRAQSMADAWLLLSRLGTGWGAAQGPLLSMARQLPFVLPALACLHFLHRLPSRPPAPLGPRVLTVSALLLCIALGWWTSLSGGGGNAFIYFQF